jgi:hypothetical protein
VDAVRVFRVLYHRAGNLFCMDAILTMACCVCSVVYVDDHSSDEYMTAVYSLLPNHNDDGGRNNYDDVYHNIRSVLDSSNTHNTHWILGSCSCNYPKTGIQGKWHNH